MPASSNGASSMHLWWDAPAAGEVAATLEIVEPPAVDRLYFWALQATFVDGRGRPIGGAHLGLQWYGAHPGSTAVNWGGYRSDGSGELDGSTSELPSATGNGNTRDFAWRPSTAYRLRISADGTGSVTDLTSGERTVVRRLDVGGAVALTDRVVWSEVFAACDDPPTTVRWSELDPSPGGLRVTYQTFEDGGCSNTAIEPDGDDAFLQRTNVARSPTAE